MEIKFLLSAIWKRIGAVFHLKKNEVVFHLVPNVQSFCFEAVLKLFWDWLDRVGNSDYKANLVQLPMKLQAGTELGNNSQYICSYCFRV